MTASSAPKHTKSSPTKPPPPRADQAGHQNIADADILALPKRISLASNRTRICEQGADIPEPITVILQDGLTIDDVLNDPKLWLKVQESTKRLVRWQQVTVVERTGDRAIVGWVVADASPVDGVVLRPPTGIVKGNQLGSDWRRDDGEELVTPHALGGWVRKSLRSGNQIGLPYPSRDAAIHASNSSRPTVIER